MYIKRLIALSALVGGIAASFATGGGAGASGMEREDRVVGRAAQGEDGRSGILWRVAEPYVPRGG